MDATKSRSKRTYSLASTASFSDAAVRDLARMIAEYLRRAGYDTQGEEPALLSVAQTERRLNLGHTKLYELISDGRIEAVKQGRSTRLRTASVRAYEASLPPAPIAPQKRARSN
jgi:excisionase family DNA binding protein